MIQMFVWHLFCYDGKIKFMRNLNWKIATSLFTFFVGTVLAFTWVVLEPKIIKSIDNSESIESQVETPFVAPKPISSSDPSYLKGRNDAERDLMAGKFLIKVKGQTTLFANVLNDELAKYGATTDTIGCFYKESDEEHLKGYNEVSIAGIDSRFGKGVAEQALKKATAQQGWSAAE